MRKRLRNDGGRIKCEFNGMDYYFNDGEERDVDSEMAEALEFRFAHLGLHIVEPEPEAPAAEPEVAEILPIPEVVAVPVKSKKK